MNTTLGDQSSWKGDQTYLGELLPSHISHPITPKVTCGIFIFYDKKMYTVKSSPWTCAVGPLPNTGKI
jgi:hypothetical protein